MKEFSSKTQKPLMGQTLIEVRKVLGGMGHEVSERWWGERTVFWNDPGHGLGILGSFRNEGVYYYLHHLVVIDRMKELNVNAALAIGYAATLPYSWSKLNPQQLKSSFNIKTRDGQQRFLLKWYKDPRTGMSLHVVDELAERVALQKKEEKENRNLDKIKNLL